MPKNKKFCICGNALDKELDRSPCGVEKSFDMIINKSKKKKRTRA